MGPGPLIAIDVLLLYTILGPLVLFSIYVLFDSLGNASSQDKKVMAEKDSALWTGEDIETSDFGGYVDRFNQ